MESIENVVVYPMGLYVKSGGGAEYRIVELASPADDPLAGQVFKRFDSAYRGMEALRAAVARGEARAQAWYLVDGSGRILLRPGDVYDLAE